ncbi:MULTISPECIES: LysE family translocator [Staphylococcus]|uniref:LysE family translocator n=1 Tax=Staphylococcus TaxID=1279 RepID=UPI0009C09EC8|nr:LysE family transporter [Staphylococcus saprophyticus]
MAVLGSATAHIIYISLSVAGLIILLTNFYFIFQTIKILGIIYLIYLGISSIISSFKKDDINQLYTVDFDGNNKNHKLISYRQGFLSTLLNPKAILFLLHTRETFI